jgi:hypothetical protein
MAPVPKPSSPQPVWIAVSVIGGVLFMAILPFLATGIWIFCRDLWWVMITNRSRYLEAEILRKEWNKAAWTEQRRQDIAICLIRNLIEKEGKPEEKWFLFLELVREKALRLGDCATVDDGDLHSVLFRQKGHTFPHESTYLTRQYIFYEAGYGRELNSSCDYHPTEIL